MLRVLGGIRLSRLTDESSSPARQRGVIDNWTVLQDAELVGVAEDLDVSGAVSPFERPNLGPWLTDPDRVDAWDVLVVWKLDRVSRSALDTLHLLNWAKEHGKRIVAVSDSLDSSTNMGRAWIQFAAVFAEMEREAIRERILATRVYQRLNGLWRGGNPPYGTRPKKTDAGYVLEEDPKTAPIVREIVARSIAGEARHAIARDLNDRGVPTARQVTGSKAGREAIWHPGTIRNLLRSLHLRGYSTYRGNIVLTPDGEPLRCGPELVTADEWDLLQTQAETLAAPYKKTTAVRTPLYGVVLCQCGAAMVGSRNSDGSRRYICPRSTSRVPADQRCRIAGSVRADVVEEYAEREFLALVGRMALTKRTTIPGRSTAGERKELEAALERLDAAYRAGAYDGDVESYAQMRKGLRRKLDALAAQPDTPATVELKETGITYQEMWDMEDEDGRRQLLLHNSFRVTVGPRVRRGRTSREEVETRLSFERVTE